VILATHQIQFLEDCD
jgi:ABC-type multidrug transport system ATPase subunit